MIQRILASKNLAAYALACATGLTLYFMCPFPSHDPVLRLVALREPAIYDKIRYIYVVFLFTTPYILFSVVLSGFYVFALHPRKRATPLALPEYADPSQRDTLFLTLGEVHNPRKPVPIDEPYWMNVPERGLFTGIAIFGAIGTGKTAAAYIHMRTNSLPTDPAIRNSELEDWSSRSRVTSAASFAGSSNPTDAG